MSANRAHTGIYLLISCGPILFGLIQFLSNANTTFPVRLRQVFGAVRMYPLYVRVRARVDVATSQKLHT